MKPKKKEPNWTDLKRKLVDLDKTELIDLIKELRAADKANQIFLNTRFQLSENTLEPYKVIIEKSLCPDIYNHHPISISKAKKAISDYYKAAGQMEGLAELRVYYCECCKEFLSFCGLEDISYFDALAEVFELALKSIHQLSPADRPKYVARLESVVQQSSNWGWDFDADLDNLMFGYGFR